NFGIDGCEHARGDGDTGDHARLAGDDDRSRRAADRNGRSGGDIAGLAQVLGERAADDVVERGSEVELHGGFKSRPSCGNWGQSKLNASNVAVTRSQFL